MRLRDLTPADLADIETWRYDGEWSTYDVTGPIDPADGFWAVVRPGAGGEDLVGYACFGPEARVSGLAEVVGVVDVGVGMRPSLTGGGLGPELGAAVLDHAVAAGATRLRAVVQDWNERSLRLVARLGFTRTGTHQVGDVTYVVLERTA